MMSSFLFYYVRPACYKRPEFQPHILPRFSACGCLPVQVGHLGFGLYVWLVYVCMYVCMY